MQSYIYPNKYRYTMDKNTVRENDAQIGICVVSDTIEKEEEDLKKGIPGKYRESDIAEDKKFLDKSEVWMYDEIVRHFRDNGYSWKASQRKTDIIMRCD